jgi:hypothetical protein
MLTYSENVIEVSIVSLESYRTLLVASNYSVGRLGWLEKEIELWVWASVLTTPDGNINCLRVLLLTPRCRLFFFFSFSLFSFACYIWVESLFSSATRRRIIGFSGTQCKVFILRFVALKTGVYLSIRRLLCLPPPHFFFFRFSERNRAVAAEMSMKSD